jgi:hypothetical protein
MSCRLNDGSPAKPLAVCKPKLGRSVLAHGHFCCSSNVLVSRPAFLRSVTAYLFVLLATGPQMARRLGGLLDANYGRMPGQDDHGS